MKYHNKQAFTLLEVVFVIVILGIVASVGSTIIAQLYENYIVQRAMHRVSVKTELAVNQIVNRLTYRISTSVIARDPAGGGSFMKLVDIPMGVSNKNNTILEWIGYDNDSFSAQARPGWTGYCDTTATASPNIETPGSDLTFTNTVIGHLSGGSTPALALLFSLSGNEDTPGTGVYQDANCYGYNGDTSCIHQVSISGTKLTTNRVAGTNISSHYKLAWTAYALVPVAPADGTAMTDTHFDLELRYNYQPWNGTQYSSAQGSTILRNVTAFKFAEQGGTIRIKLCATEQIGDSSTTNISICKEKVVIR
jgi:prepilin-type N-terminal cleavage/methylation domain-containing protein